MAPSIYTQAVNDVTDGLDPSGSGLDEPFAKANKELKNFQTIFKKAFDKYYK